MAGPENIFDLGARALSAQMVRINTTASNIANAGTVASTADAAYKPLRTVFETAYSAQFTQDGLATTDATQVVSLDRPAVKTFRPGSPQADKDGYVYASPVNTDEEMIEMTDASRQYQNILDSVSTLRALMSRTLNMGQ